MLAAGTTLGRFRILGPLGTGGMGEVYRANDSRLAREVAIKVVRTDFTGDPGRFQRFEQEARAAGALNHPNVCTIFDVGTHEGAPFVVMELLEGVSLRSQLREGALPLRKSLEYAAQAARGLAAAHEKGIVHRDLKPENLFLTRDGRLKVLDFGLAKLMRPEIPVYEGATMAATTATVNGAILGTSGYMAPEQLRGQQVDARADIFALGVVVYEMVSGGRPFSGGSFAETSAAVLNAEPAPLSSSHGAVPSALDALVRHCLEKEPAQRFQSAADLAFALESLAVRETATPPLALPTFPLRKRRLRGAMLLAVLAGALLAIPAMLYVIGRQRPVTDITRLDFTQLTFERAGFMDNARFSPDGSSVLYSASWGGRPFEVYETRPGFVVSRSLGLGATHLLSVSSAGELAVSVGDGVAEVPMTGGAPRRLFPADVGDAQWQPGGTTLAIVRVEGGRQRLEMPPGRVLYETPAATDKASFRVQPLRWSPDGRYLAVWEGVAGERVVVVDTTGRAMARADVSGRCWGMAWSADGRELWYSVSRDGVATEFRALTPGGRGRIVARFQGIMVLWDISRDGRALIGRYVSRTGISGNVGSRAEGRELGWYDYSAPGDISDDGRTLLFSAGGLFGGEFKATCIRGMDGSPPVKLGDGFAMGLSPDGQWALALQLGETPRLVLLPTGAGNPVVLPRHFVDKYREACWMPDGTHILFNGAEAGHEVRTYIQDTQGGAPRPITPAGVVANVGPRQVSPDGRRILYVAGRQYHLKAVEAESGRAFAGVLRGEMVVGWAADGNHLYVAQQDTSIHMSLLDVRTGDREPWKNIDIGDRAGWMLDKVMVTSSGDALAVGYIRGASDLYLVTGLR
jgi:eukaryotic-like serine/threonine-protein kinase